MAKKIKKDEGPIKPALPPPVPDQFEETEVEGSEISLEGSAKPRQMPEELNVERFQRELQKQQRIAEIRRKEIDSFKPVPGWKIIKTIEYDNTDEGFERSAEKELKFLEKIQPQNKHKLDRRPYIGFISRKGLPKSMKG